MKFLYIQTQRLKVASTKNIFFTLKQNVMLRWTIIFLVIAIIAGILGFTGIAAGAAEIAKIFFYIFLVLFVVSLFFGRRTID
jgi:uncharacterized membrane protein YtjA (UPF0391 family)